LFGTILGLVAVGFAGCVGDAPTVPAPAAPAAVVLQGIVLDSADGRPVANVALRLETLSFVVEDMTGKDGRFEFRPPELGPCVLYLERAGYGSGDVLLDCTRSRHVTIHAEPGTLERPASAPTVRGDAPIVPGADATAPLHRLAGTVSAGGEPVAGAEVVLEMPGAAQAQTTWTSAVGSFLFLVADGAYTIRASAPCTTPVTRDLAVADDIMVELALPGAALKPPAAPRDLVVTPGPGIAQATVSWRAPTDAGSGPVDAYTVHRDGQPFAHVGNTLAYGDTGAAPGGHSYAVSAHNVCGLAGPTSASASGTPLPGVLLAAGVSQASGITTAVRYYDVLDANGTVFAQRAWRTVDGVGNCCETYVAANAAGRLFEYGGTQILYSDDEGSSWNVVSNVVPHLVGEGAIVGAPGGDVLAVNWAAYEGDQLWSHKYVAATGQWYTARTPLHQPLFDRPWVAVIEGPFTIEGVVVPYLSLFMSNYVHGDILLMSLDGLQYQPPTAAMLATTGLSVSLDLPPDRDRDWIQSMRETSVYPIDGGLGLRDRSVIESCDQAVLGPDAMWHCPTWSGVSSPPRDGEVLRVDSAGGLHILAAESGGRHITYRVSHDGGATWASQTAQLPRGLVIEDWDVQANAALDQTVVVVHASESDAAGAVDQDLVFRFRNIGAVPVLDEILLVGRGDHVFGGGLGSAYDRFDYTTVALLPSGRVAISFGDSEFTTPAVAVEMGGGLVPAATGTPEAAGPAGTPGPETIL
jgi:hypothetical protein